MATGSSGRCRSAPASLQCERPNRQGSVVLHVDQQVADERRLFGMRLREDVAVSRRSFSRRPAEGAGR